MWDLVRPYKGFVARLALVSFLGALLEAAFLVLMTGTVLALASSKSTVGPVLGVSIPITWALGVAGVAVIVRLLVGLLGVRFAAGLTAHVTTDQRRRLSAAYLSADWDTQQAEPSGRLQELLTSFVGRATTAAASLTQGITAGLSLVAFLGTGFVIEPLATGVVLVLLGVLGAVLAPLRRHVRRLSGKLAVSNLSFANAVSELGSLGQEMQSFGVQDQFKERVSRLTVRTTDDSRRVQIASGALSPTYTFLAYVAVIAAMAMLSTWEIANLAAVGSVMLLMLRSLSYAQSLLNVSGHLASTLPFLEQLEQTASRYEEHRASGGTVTPSAVTPVEVQHVTFQYSEERPALAGVTVLIARGEIIGVIGPSGSGKSTFAQLILGLRNPTEGQITVDGVDLRRVDRHWWAQKVAFVPQDPLLFTGTVAENIRFFREGIGDQDLRRAARQANFLRDIESLPGGFSTHLGERGSQLSGGQRQRLSIARALVSEPSLLVLDEPTSALDGESEALVRGTLEELHGNTTMVVIAHRMSTLDLCDRIMVIENGQLTAFDTPEELKRRSAFYRRALTGAGLS